MGAPLEKRKIDWEYLSECFSENNTSMSEVCKLLGRSTAYLSYYKSTSGALPVADINTICDLMDIDESKLYVDECSDEPEDTSGDVLTKLIAEIGELRGKIVELEKRVDNPVEVSIPMSAKDMAVRVFGGLLDGGWVSKDAVLSEFSKHHIPVEYISDAMKANNAISATSGVASGARTFYIKAEEVRW